MNWENYENKRLVDAILLLKNEGEVQNFLRDLLTENEISEFGKRLQAAEMLTNKKSYTSIVAATGLSSATIARVSKWLQGTQGGYTNVINKLHHHAATNVSRG